MKTALISDFDGTLYFRETEEQFRAQDVFDILFFRKRGGVFGICTGRSPDSIFDLVGSFMRPDFIISVSGALIVDGEGKILDSCCMDPAAAEAIYKDFKKSAEIVIHAGGRVYCLGEKEYPLQIRVFDFSELPLSFIYGLSMRFESEEAAAEAASRIKRKYGPFADAFRNVRHVDIVAAGCSKGTGVRKVKEIFKLDRIAGIGDSYNDLPLIEASDVGFTFQGAPEELRNAADEIVLSVSQAIEKI